MTLEPVIGLEVHVQLKTQSKLFCRCSTQFGADPNTGILLTDINGYIAEGPGANVFFEKDGRLFTPATGNILPGITRATVFELCTELGIPVEEGSFTPQDLRRADAAFFCGTAAEVIGWESYDDRPFPTPWKDSLSRKVQLAYKDLVIEKTNQKKHQLETI